MVKKQSGLAGEYFIVVGIANDKTQESFEAGDTEMISDEWDIKGLLAIGAIEKVDISAPVKVAATNQKKDEK